MPTIRERLQAVLDECAGELEALEDRRSKLEEERAEAIVRIREEFAEKIAAVDADLEAARRMQKALEGPKPRTPKEEKPKQRQPRTPDNPGRERPSQRVLGAVLAAIAGGADIVGLMTDSVDYSRGSVENALPWLRGDGLIRLTGERKIDPDNPKVHNTARTYAITPEGEEYLRANLSTNGTPA
jgi:hypothetical protein